MTNSKEKSKAPTNEHDHDAQSSDQQLLAQLRSAPKMHCPVVTENNGLLSTVVPGDNHAPADKHLAGIEVISGSNVPLAPESGEVTGKMNVNDRGVTAAFQIQVTKPGLGGSAVPLGEEHADVLRRNPTQANILLDLALAADVFHTSEGIGYADLDINGHRETWPIRSKQLSSWLARIYYDATEGAPSPETRQSVLRVLEAKALFDGPERAVHTRVAGHGDRLYLDLADEAWRAVEIDAAGWRVIERPRVRFRRAAGMLPLPSPEAGGTVNALRPFLNVASDADFVLVVAWALAVLRDRGPYPLLGLSGEQGSAKSTLSAILQTLLDPNAAPLRALPREERDLFIAANNAHVLGFDNLSGVSAWVSDTLCRLATGGGFATRQLRTDQDEVLFNAARPIILNGIEDVVTRPDLADRSILIRLETIPEEQRRPERELWAAFELERPRILGALLDAVVVGLQRLPNTRLDTLPRMADFAQWATACETALWPAGAFSKALTENLAAAADDVIDANLVASAVRDLMAKKPDWTGTATDLLGALKTVAGEHYAKSKRRPDNPRALSGQLRRAAPVLRKRGIDIIFAKEGHSRTRTIHITKQG